jgi:hypothetical protein
MQTITHKSTLLNLRPEACSLKPFHPPLPFRIPPSAFRILSLFLSLFLLSVSSPFSHAADDPTTPPFRLEIAPAVVTIGDAVRLVIHPQGPDPDANKIRAVAFDGGEDRIAMEQCELAGPWCRYWPGKEKGKPGDWHATIRPFAVGEIALPPIVVAYTVGDGETRELRLTSATLTVQSIRPDGAQSLELYGLRDVADLPRDWTWLSWAGGVAAAAALMAWALMLLLRRRRPVPAPVEAPVPPGMWALLELERRSRLPVCQTGPAKTIYSMVSEVVRLYMQRRWHIPAIDMTTRECLNALAGRGLDDQLLQWMRHFLDECDLVKFTPHPIARERWATVWNDAKLIVQHTTPAAELNSRLPPGVASASAGNPRPPAAESARP